MSEENKFMEKLGQIETNLNDFTKSNSAAIQAASKGVETSPPN